MDQASNKYDVGVKFWGDLACFTRPEFKVERVTYQVMTPSAARGALEAIFWKPEFRWEIREIQVLNPVKEIAIIRNEVKDRQSQRNIGPFIIEDKRQQRTSLFLKDVAYLVWADIRLKANNEHNKKKYMEQFQRRLKRGQCHHQPYLGTRECAAYFSAPEGDEPPISDSTFIGNMLFDIAFCKSNIRREMEFLEHGDHEAIPVTGYKKSLFFPAQLDHGVLSIPTEKYVELYGLEGVNVKGAC